MLPYRLFRPSWFSLLRVSCPACRAGMLVTSIEPDRPGYDTRIFECVPCEISIVEVFATSRRPVPQPQAEQPLREKIARYPAIRPLSA